MQLKIFLNLFLFSIFCSVHAQSISETLFIADQHFSNGEYDPAIKAYRRVLFFSEQQAPEIYTKLAESYLKSNNFEKAIYYFNFTENAALTDSLKLEAGFRKVATYLIANKILFAKNELLGMPVVESDYFKFKTNYYHAIIELQQGNVEHAHVFLKEIFPETIHGDLEKYLKKAEKKMKKKPLSAMVLSAAIPGLGQVYAGDWKDGANSFVLNALTTSLYIYVVYQYSILDALIAVMPWWHRYYVGGFMNAKRKVAHTNEIETNKVLKEILLWYDEIKTIP